MKGKEKNKRKNRGKRIAVFLLSLLTVFSFSPLSQARADDYTRDSRTLTMDTGQTYNGVGIAGHEVSTKMTDYIRRALSTLFVDKNSGRWMDLASAWNNLAHGFAVSGANKDGLKEATNEEDCSYRWRDFKDKDMPKDLYQKVLSAGAAGWYKGDWWSTITCYNHRATDSEGYRYEKKYDKNFTDTGTWIYYYTSGLQQASSLDTASSNIESTIKASARAYNKRYKECTPKKFEWGEEGKKVQDVFYIDDGFAACSNAAGRMKRQSRYAHTGVFFYNFKVTPYYAAAKDHTIIGDKEGTFVGEKAVERSAFHNTTEDSMTKSFKVVVNTTDATSMTVNHSTTNTKTNGWGVKVGLSGERVWKDIAKIGASFEFNYSHTASNAFSDGWSKTTSETHTLTQENTVSGPIRPGYTLVTEGEMGYRYHEATFNAPLMLSFDVAVVNWVIDPSKDSAKDQCALVAQFGSAHGYDNATDEIRSKADSDWWIKQFHQKIKNLTGGFEEGSIWARACADNIPISDQTVTVKRKVPEANVYLVTYDQNGNKVSSVKQDIKIDPNKKAS